jgi:hypothetical protein
MKAGGKERLMSTAIRDHIRSNVVRYVLPAVLALVAIAAAGTAIAGSGKSATSDTSASRRANLGTTGEENYRSSAAVLNPAGVLSSKTVLCATARHVTGGGVQTSSSLQDVNESRPVDSTADADSIPDDGWIAFVRNEGGSDANFTVYAICDD